MTDNKAFNDEVKDRNEVSVQSIDVIISDKKKPHHVCYV